MKKIIFAVCVLLAVSLSAQTTQPVVAIHVSEQTQALATTPATSPTPTGSGTTGNQWWTPWWQPFVMSEALKEALRSDGTPFVVVTDADIAAGQLLTATGAPAYPIVISLANEAISNNEITPLLSYVNAGGFLFVGSSSFTRNPDGTTRGDFALASQLGLHMTVSNLQNWYQNASFTNSSANNQLTSHIPVGTLAWQMPLTSEDISWGTSPHPSQQSQLEAFHYIWQVTSSSAKVIATADKGLPYITTTPYGQGYFIYDAAMQPMLGFGGFAPGMYTYGIFRNAIQWAFQSANIPIAKVSPWPYKYNAAYMVRHDFEDYQSDISGIASSAQFEHSLGALGEYYFCTGTLRVEMGNSPTVIAGLQQAASQYGATIGSHNGGLRNPNNPSLVVSNYDYWHWGPDEALDDTIPGYSSGSAYAAASISQSFSDISSWLSGYEPNLKTWVAPYFNGTREGTYKVLQQVGAATAGEQKMGPFPHWTLSTQTNGLRYNFLSMPVSDWYFPAGACGDTDCVSCGQSYCVSQSIGDAYGASDVDAAVDYYYNIGALINIYMHELSSDTIPAEYIRHSSSKSAVWPVNSVTLLGWWTNRSPVQISPSYTIANNHLVLTTTISGATDPTTAVEFVIPNWAVTSGSLQVLLNGATASPSSYRTYGNGIKVNVGTSVSTVQISYGLPSTTPSVSSVTLNPATVTSGTPSTGTVTLNEAAPSGGAVVTLTSGNTAVATVPASVTVPSGSTSATFSVTTLTVTTSTNVSISAAYSGSSQSATLTVQPTGSTGTALFSDNFSGANGSDPLWTTVLGTWAISNGMMTGTGSSNNYAYTYANNGTSWTNYTVQGQIQFPTGAYGGGIGGRVNPSTGAHYGVWVYPASSLIYLVKFSTWTNWGSSAVAQASVPSVGTSPHTLLVSFNGNVIQVSFDGVQYINVTDNSTPALTSGSISLDMWNSTTPYVMDVKNIVVQALAAVPVAQNDAYSTLQGTALNVSAPGVLANDSVNGSSSGLTAVLSSPPSNGTLVLQSNGAFTYTPASSFTGTDSFTYTANAAGVSSNVATVTITVAPLSVSSVTLNPATVISGAPSTGTVTLNAAAPSGGTVVTLKSSNTAAATVPASVTVPAGSTSATFTVSTSAVTTSTSVSITATYSGNSQSATLTVAPLSVSSLTLNPATVTSGTPSTGTVTLNAAAPSGGTVVTLKSSNTAAATVPASVTVPAGSTSATFTVSTSAVTTSTSVSVTATYSGSSQSATLTVAPLSVSSVTLNPATVTSGTPSTGTVTLNAAAPSGGTVVTLKSSNTAAATVPASVTVPAGSTSTTFTVSTSAVTTSTSVSITATYSSSSQSATLTVAPLSVLSLTLNPATVTSGTPSTGTVTLNAAAPSGGTVVTLTSSNTAAATVPASVTVSAGSTSATFTVTTLTVTTSTTVNVTASYSGSSQSATLTEMASGTQVLFSDTFSGANGPDPLWTTESGTWAISNGVMTGTGSIDNYAYTYVNGSWTNYTVQGQVQFPAGAYGGGIGGRLNPSTGAHYGVWVYPEGSAGGSSVIKLVKFTGWTNWSGTPMAQASLPGVGTSAHTLLISFQGNVIQVSYDGVQYINVTDTSFSSGGISLDMWTYSTPYVMDLGNITVNSQ